MPNGIGGRAGGNMPRGGGSLGGGRRPLRSESGWEGGTYESATRGPGGGGRFRMPVGGGGPGFPGDFMGMFESMMAEKMAGTKGARRREEERHSEWMREQRRKRAPKMAAAPRGRKPVDPMRYIEQHRQAARTAQGQKGGFTGIGQLSMKHEGERAAKEAAQMYPLYAQAMMAG